VQLVELQHAWPALERRGVALFGVSYDSVETLAGFAEKRGITYPLLSDEGSHTIRALGLLNEHLAEQHAVYGIKMRDEHQGVAYPGTFVLDEQGIIVDKHFEQSYRVRPTAQLFEDYVFGANGNVPPSHAVHTRVDGVDIQAWTDSPTYRPYQQVRLQVQLALPAGVHAYGAPTPRDYTPLTLDVESRDGLTLGEIDLPAPHRFHMDGLDEEFLVYEGTFRMTVPMMLTSNLGSTSLGFELGFQTCTRTTCSPPISIHLELPLSGLDLIRD
jgi:peroxiredoxin